MNRAATMTGRERDLDKVAGPSVERVHDSGRKRRRAEAADRAPLPVQSGAADVEQTNACVAWHDDRRVHDGSTAVTRASTDRRDVATNSAEPRIEKERGAALAGDDDATAYDSGR